MSPNVAADEYLRVCYALWDAWEPDAVVIDRERGIWAHPEKIHAPHFHGAYYGVEEALGMPSGPQRRPVIVQAGQSEEGKEFAARHAEMIYTAKNTIDVAQQFYADVKGRTEALGRPRSSLRILPGLVPIIGDSRAEARVIAEEIADLAQEEIAMERLTLHLLGLDISDLPVDRPIPPELLIPLDVAAESPAMVASRYPNLYRLIVEEKPTIRELMRRPDVSQGGHQAIVGTAQDVADEMQRWFESDSCDGFGVIPPYMPEGLERFCAGVVPILQERGLFRTEYPGTTLRDTLGLAIPALETR